MCLYVWHILAQTVALKRNDDTKMKTEKEKPCESVAVALFYIVIHEMLPSGMCDAVRKRLFGAFQKANSFYKCLFATLLIIAV